MKKLALCLLGFLLILGGCKKDVSLDSVSKDLSIYNLEITLNEDMTLEGKENLTYINNTGETLDHICFHLYPTAFSEGAINTPVSKLNESSAYSNGKSYGDIAINSLLVDGKEVTPKYSGEDENILIVDLPKKLSKDKKVDIEIGFSVILPNINHRFGYGANTINLANFYPIVAVYENGDFICNPYHYNGDPFFSDMANYNVKLTAPKNLVLASSGTINSTNEGEINNSYEMSAKVVRDFAMVLSEKFQMIESSTGGTRIMYYYYDDDTPEESLQTAVDSINTFNELFGEYPYSTLSVVQTNFVHGGMEFPNLVYISDAVTEKASYKNVIIHEIAHQWWYQLVGSDAYRYPWLDEGLTEFSTVLFYEQNPQYNVSPEETIKNTTNNYVSFIDLYHDIIGDIDESMTRALNEYNTETEYVYMTYVKGCLFFDSLRDTVGQKKFMKSLKQYFENSKFKNVTPEDFIGTFEKVCHTDLSGFFHSWVDGKVIIQKIA